MHRHDLARLPARRRSGLLYGYRVHGPYRTQRGQRFNPNKLLLDPYAKATFGRLHWTDANYAYKIGAEREDLSFDRRDNAAATPKCQVIGALFEWDSDKAPGTPWSESIIYELHVKGFTALHPSVPEPLRGSYAGLACAPVIAHLERLGVTAVELLPMHCFVDERAFMSNAGSRDSLASANVERRIGSRKLMWQSLASWADRHTTMSRRLSR